jgi:hypothetical protein
MRLAKFLGPQNQPQWRPAEVDIGEAASQWVDAVFVGDSGRRRGVMLHQRSSREKGLLLASLSNADPRPGQVDETTLLREVSE